VGVFSLDVAGADDGADELVSVCSTTVLPDKDYRADYNASHYNAIKNDDALQRYSEQTERCYQVLEGQLKKSGGQSILPGRVTAVDYHFEPWVRQFDFAGLSLDKYPHVSRWLREMTGRKEVQQAYIKVKGAAPEFS
jgi:glutathione S-transferase